MPRDHRWKSPDPDLHVSPSDASPLMTKNPRMRTLPCLLQHSKQGAKGGLSLLLERGLTLRGGLTPGSEFTFRGTLNFRGELMLGGERTLRDALKLRGGLKLKDGL